MNSKINKHVPDELEIAPGYTVGAWKALSLDDPKGPDWAEAIKIFKVRIHRRFIDPVDVLIAHEIGHARGTFGFAILAIDCIIMETLQGSRDGVLDHGGHSRRLISKFLTKGKQFSKFFSTSAEAKDFYSRYRSALLHTGKTEGDMRIRCSGPLLLRVGDTRIDINRTAVHEAVKCDFALYLKELADCDNTELRANFRKVMNAICGMKK